MTRDLLHPLAVRAALLLTWPLILTGAFGVPLPIAIRVVDYLKPDSYAGGMTAENAALLLAWGSGISITILSCWPRYRFLLAPGTVMLVLHAVLLLESVDGGAGWMRDVFTVVSALPFAGAAAWAATTCVAEARAQAHSSVVADVATGGGRDGSAGVSSDGLLGQVVPRASTASGLLVTESLMCIQIPSALFLCLFMPALDFGAPSWEIGAVVLATFVGLSAVVGLGGLRWASYAGMPRQVRLAHLIPLVCLGGAVTVAFIRFLLWSVLG